MIVVENKASYLFFEQHEHGKVSGEIGKRIKDEWVLSSERLEDVEFAIRNHDYSWVDLDKKPLWNDAEKRPYSFMDYPLREKLNAYKKGIDFVQQSSDYAALLCSLHYTSFLENHSTNPMIISFISREMDRRSAINSRMVSSDNELLSHHLKILQVCDDLSLYLCLNKPGVRKENEFPWFKNGFRQKFPLAPNGLYAEWKENRFVKVAPSLFLVEFTVEIPFKEVLKEDISEVGMDKAYNNGTLATRKCLIK